uniref:Lethal giant larvae homologue 2 domain-containing protein n=1 Tax=Panagrolaimus superbus TaxID=310955 RepID=A0A914ZBB2_9BILA
MAFDPVQKLIAIGAGHGEVRLLGQAGVDYFLKHESDEPVVHLQFLINEGGLITVQRDDSIHLWNYRQKTPEIVNSMQMSKEKVSCIYLPFQSKWLYVGTDKGNIYFICLANFELSTYVINWNKAIDLSCRIHPGCVKHLSLCPTETHKLLIGFEKSHISLWNLQTKEAEQFAVGQPQIKCISWHHDGKQFMAGHSDGSLTIWNLRKSTEPQQKINPHVSNTTCRPITNLIWQHNAEGEQLVIFVGGLPTDDGALPAVSIMRGRPTKSTVVAEMDHQIVNILPLNSSPFINVPQHPYGIAVLLKSEFLIIDLFSQGFSCFDNPHSMDIHESPVTFITYFSDCPVDLIAAFTLVGRNQRKQGVKNSERPWPLTGGVEREGASGHQEMLITGHEDGSVKFWQASSEYLQVMYKLKTGRHFEKIDETKNVSYAVTDVQLCLDSRLLLISSASGQVTLFRFVKTESSQDIAVVTLSQLCASNRPSSPPINDEEGKIGNKELRRQLETSDSRSTATSTGSDIIEQIPIRVRGGSMRRPAGYTPELVCQIPWIGGHTPEIITSMALNSAYGVLCIATMTGVALVDIVSYTLIYTWANTEICNRDSIPLLPLQNSEASPSEPQTPTITVPEENKTFVGLFRRATADFGGPRRGKKLSLAMTRGQQSFETSRPSCDPQPPLTVDTTPQRPSTLTPLSAGCDQQTLTPPTFQLHLPPSRSHSMKKIVRRVTVSVADRLKRAKSFQATAMEENSESSMCSFFCVLSKFCRPSIVHFYF